MVTKSSKLLVLFIALLIVLSVFMGCDTKKSGKVDEGQSLIETDGQGNEQENDGKEHKEEESEEDAIDMDGYIVRLAAMWEPNPPIGFASDIYAKKVRYYEEKYNCKIIWINPPMNEYYRKFIVGALTGYPESDATLMLSQWLPGIMRKGLCYDLTYLVDINDKRYYRKHEIESLGIYNERVYALRTANMLTKFDNVMFYNKSMAEREGLGDISTMKEDKNWTWGKMIEMAQKVTKDTDGDGEIDQWGISSINPMALIYSNGGEMTREEKDTIKVAFDSPQAAEALQFYQDLFQKYKVVGGEWETFKAGKSLFHSDQYDKIYDLDFHMKKNYNITWYPIGPKGRGYRNLVKETKLYVLPSCAKYPEAFLRILEGLTSPFNPNEPVPPYFESFYDKMFEGERDLENIIAMHKETIVFTDYSAWQDWPDIIGEMFDSIRLGEMTPQAAVDGIKAQAQSGIDIVLNG